MVTSQIRFCFKRPDRNILGRWTNVEKVTCTLIILYSTTSGAGIPMHGKGRPPRPPLFPSIKHMNTNGTPHSSDV